MSEICRGKINRCAHPPTWHGHGLATTLVVVTVREPDTDGLCLDGRDGIGDIINHPDNGGLMIDDVGLDPSIHLLDYMTAVVEDVCPYGAMRSARDGHKP